MRKRKSNFIPKNTSRHNDSLKDTQRSIKKTEKNHTSILGLVVRSPRRHQFVLTPFLKDFPGVIFLNPKEIKSRDASMHQIVRVELKKMGGKTQRGRDYVQNFEGKVVEEFASIDDPELELAIVQEAQGFPIQFSNEAIRVAETGAELMKNPGERVDLTKTLHVTIDGETAKDFDDAICVTRKSAEIFNLKVSIADVSFFVPENSALDRDAYERGTSIYFPDRAIPMLPEVLSTNLCSLVPDQERFTLTCEMDVDRQGKCSNVKIYPSVILSKARLTYTLVSKIIEKNEKGLVKPEIESMLKDAFELSLIVRSARKAKGGLDLDLPETEMEIDKEGNVVKTFVVERNEAHKLIEDFMVLANECVSEAIEKADYPSVFRIHEEPDPLKIDRLKKVVQRWGFKLSATGDMIDSLQNYLNEVKQHPAAKILTVSLLRSLKQAKYSATNAGHFGLGSDSYTHFTSPIRRYPDLMIHRILRNSHFLKDADGPYEFDKLMAMCERCSETERRAFLAERDLEDMKKTRFMEKFVGQTFDAIVVSVKSFGLFVEILPHGIDGLIPMRSLPGDYWDVDELESRLVGRRSGEEYWLGDQLKIVVAEVDRVKRQIHLRPVQATHKERPAKNENKKSGRQGDRNSKPNQKSDKKRNKVRWV